jgi:hypothetical protein
MAAPTLLPPAPSRRDFLRTAAAATVLGGAGPLLPSVNPAASGGTGRAAWPIAGSAAPG